MSRANRYEQATQEIVTDISRRGARQSGGGSRRKDNPRAPRGIPVHAESLESRLLLSAVSFGAQTTFPVGKAPASVAVADLGNGQQDLVTANQSDNTVSVLLGNGDGTFEPQQTYATGASPGSVAIADLGNGHDDLVISNADDNTVSVLLGNGDGTFKAQQTYSVGANPESVAIADLGNGHADLVVANADNTVSVLLGNGNGTFQSQQTYATGGGSYGVAIADLGNGQPDLIVANFFDNTVSVLLGNGNGTFKTQQTYATGNGPQSVAVADLGNGKDDVIVSNDMDNTVSVLLGNGNGSFQAQQSYATGNKPKSVAVADLGNGKDDLIVANYTDNTLSVLPGNGNGTFQAQQTLAVGGGAYAATVADVNHDGRPDIVAVNATNNVSVLLNNLTNFATKTSLSPSASSVQVGAPVTFTATLSPVQATGTVTLFDGSTQLGAPVTIANGVAAMTTSSLSAGGHQISAHYSGSGDGTYAASISSSVSVTVTMVALTTTTTMLTSSATSAGYGSSVSFTATITPATAPGTVTFFDGATQIGAPVTVAGGVAMFASASLATGTHSITANYSGDSNNAASNAAAISLAVAPSAVVTTSLFTNDTAWETVTVVYSSSAALGTNIGNISVTGPNSQSAYSFAETSYVSSNNGTALTVSYVVKPLLFLGLAQASALGLVWPQGTYQVTVPAGAIVDGNGVSSALATASFFTHPLLNVFVPTLNLGLKTNTIYTGLGLYARGDISFLAQAGVEKGEAIAQVVLSSDGSYSHSVLKLGAETIEIKKRGEVLRPFHSYATVVPTNIPAGSYNVLILLTDTAGYFATYESYETVRVVAGTIDLTGKFDKVPTSVKAGKDFGVTFDITNAADSTAPADGELTYYFGTSADGKLFDDSSPDVLHEHINLKPGHSMKVHLGFHLTSSAYLVVTLDPTGTPAFLPDIYPNLNFGTANIITVE